MSLEGRVAIVTGGGRGIGRAICLGLGTDGAQITVNFRKDEEAARRTGRHEALGGKAVAYQGSVALFDECRAVVDQVVADFGHVESW